MAQANTDTALKVEFVLTGKVKERVAGAQVTRASQAVAALALQHIRDRTNANEMVNGQPFPDYTPRYIIFKSRYVKGIVGGRGTRGKKGKRGTRAVGTKTEFAARKVDDNMRLSGRLFSDMVIRFVRGINDNGFVGGSFLLDFKSDRSRKIAAYNEARGRLFWGISPSTTPRGRTLRAQMKQLFKQALGIRGGGGISVGTQ